MALFVWFCHIDSVKFFSLKDLLLTSGGHMATLTGVKQCQDYFVKQCLRW